MKEDVEKGAVEVAAMRPFFFGRFYCIVKGNGLK